MWGNYVEQMDELVEMYPPDIVVYEYAERVDRSYAVKELTKKHRNTKVRRVKILLHKNKFSVAYFYMLVYNKKWYR